MIRAWFIVCITHKAHTDAANTQVLIERECAGSISIFQISINGL